MKVFKSTGMLVISVIVVIGIAAWYGWKVLNMPVYDSVKTISYSLNVKNTTNRVLENVDVRTYAPVKETSAQRCCKRLDVSHSYVMEVDDIGNQVLHFNFKTIPPFGMLVIRVTAELEMANTLNWRFSFQPDWLMKSEPLIESDHEEIKTVASSLQPEQSIPMAKKIYDWVAEHVEDIGYVQEERGALFALQNKQGDCTENAYLFTALARANRIPARPVAGYFMNDNGLLRADSYHEWAEFLEEGVWHYADPQKKQYDTAYDAYVAMRRVDNRESSPFRFARFSHSGDGLKVTMN